MEMIEKVKEENTSKKEEELSPYISFKSLLPTLIGVILLTLILALIGRYVEFKLGF